MKKLIEAARTYIKESDIATISALKFCLLSLGLLIGMALPEGVKPVMRIVCVIVFALTYVPLMAKLVRILRR